ncbi:zinc finger protein [Desulfoluna sp.]|uniref:zinc finger protein n=1 Tax=Desulfoluna sp. TaxID=2045199 RepID=UPI002637BA8D|nr:zinc finger protein [Desulfoluna sp.]
MKCPVCGYENDQEDVECIACGSDMALSAESIVIEERRSEEAMERYHEQQKELRRELGIDEPEEERLVMDEESLVMEKDLPGGEGESSLELEDIPSDFHSNDVLCPQCGFRNDEGSLECVRCGVIFSKLKRTIGNGNGLPSSSGASEQNGKVPMLDDLGECLVDAGPGYSPYVHETKTKPWAGTKATGRRIQAAWDDADFASQGQRALHGVQRLWRWLKRGKPQWYGIALAVVLVLSALPFAWKGGVHLKSRWDQSVRVKQEAKLVEEFNRDNTAIRAEIRSLANEHKFKEARAALGRFDILPLETKIKPLKVFLEEKETYARVLAVPSWKFETNFTLFSRLVALNPSSEFYRSKQDFYKKRFADQCYDKALRHYKSQKNDAAESQKAVDFIEKSLGFYPKNREFKELRSKLVRADLLFYKGNTSLQMALRDEGRGTAAYTKQRKITIWLRNSSDDILYINPDFFTLETSNGKSLKYNNMMETGLKGKLVPGEKTAGVLYFRTLAMPRQIVFEHLIAGTIQREFP